MTDVEFFFDFGSPNAWLTHAVMPAVAQRSNIRFRYRPMLLGGVFRATGNQPPMHAFAGVPSKVAWFRRELERFVARHRIPFAFNPHFPVNTLKLMRGATLYLDTDSFQPYVDACFHHMWVAPRDMGDDGMIAAALTESGFDAPAFFEGIARPEVKQALIDTTEEAVRRGVFGAPTFLLGDEVYFGKDQLRELEEDLALA